MATHHLVRVGALTAAAAAILTLGLAGSARAERPGWYSNPSIIGSSQPNVGDTLNASDGGLHCDPACVAAGPSPDRPGIYFEWVSCPTATSGGSDAPAGGLPDQRRPCPGGVSLSGMPSRTATSYAVKQSDAGRWIQLHILATNYDCGETVREGPDAGKSECNYSSAEGYSTTVGPVGGTAAAPPPPSPAPTVGPPNMKTYPTTTGTAKEGETLTAAAGTWTDSPTSYGYQWKRCDANWEPCSPINGANGATYVLTADDVNSRVQVLVTATNAKGSNAAASLPTDIVATIAVAPANSALPTISGILEDRQTLTASPGTWTGTQPISYTFQWLRCNTQLNGCAAIEGATQSTFELTREDLASRLAVTVTATNRAGSAFATSATSTHATAAKPRPGADRLAIEDVEASNGLVLATVKAGPAKVKARGLVTVNVRVTDRRGFLIEGAIVRVSGQGVKGAAGATRATGEIAFRLRAGAKLPKGGLVLTVIVSKPGDSAVTATKRVRLAVASKR